MFDAGWPGSADAVAAPPRHGSSDRPAWRPARGRRRADRRACADLARPRRARRDDPRPARAMDRRLVRSELRRHRGRGLPCGLPRGDSPRRAARCGPTRRCGRQAIGRRLGRRDRRRADPRRHFGQCRRRLGRRGRGALRRRADWAAADAADRGPATRRARRAFATCRWSPTSTQFLFQGRGRPQHLGQPARRDAGRPVRRGARGNRRRDRDRPLRASGRLAGRGGRAQMGGPAAPSRPTA